MAPRPPRPLSTHHPRTPPTPPPSLHDALPIYRYRRRHRLLRFHQRHSPCGLGRGLDYRDLQHQLHWHTQLCPRRRRWHQDPLHLVRSEEHTSQLQSLTHLVRRLLLDKQWHPAPPAPCLPTTPAHPPPPPPPYTTLFRSTDTVGVTGYYVSTSATPPAASAVGWTTVTSTTSYTGTLGYALGAGDGTKTLYTWYDRKSTRLNSSHSPTLFADYSLTNNGTPPPPPLVYPPPPHTPHPPPLPTRRSSDLPIPSASPATTFPPAPLPLRPRPWAGLP